MRWRPKKEEKEGERGIQRQMETKKGGERREKRYPKADGDKKRRNKK
ncbi:hypothetical protein AJ85_17540 [Alkalihalobacillus alcalophilus ATCC 27647 = CGMCC 1.3604]|uniref:Uncharacterized protein n=1 Tax=Alkalihalobacillus alcalophilus ATCC 27647 = CGMCC 1.3604 TaxID=1218173 RepID=A0A4V3X895_ALKAL|nr:hypothetical protein AJ85_17540 [Alkalihalobacillus alcalophilus ATCC 27647 = CGMCC 1.3604]